MSDGFDPYRKWLGIRPEEQPVNYYRLLGLAAFESDPDIIQAAADQRMAHVRSFSTGPHASLSQQLLNELSAARLCLLDPVRRAEYNRQVQAAYAAPFAPPPMPPSAPPLPASGVPPIPPYPPPAAGYVAAQGLDVSVLVEETVSSALVHRRKSSSHVMLLVSVLGLCVVGVLIYVAIERQKAIDARLAEAVTDEEIAVDNPSRESRAPAEGDSDSQGAGAGSTPDDSVTGPNTTPPASSSPTDDSPSATSAPGALPPRSRNVIFRSTVPIETLQVHGSWAVPSGGSTGAIACSAEPLSQLRIPIKPPGDYHFEASVTRQSGAGPLFMGFVVAGSQGVVSLEAEAGRQTATLYLAYSDPKVAVLNRELFADYDVVRCEVDASGGVAVSCNGDVVLTWNGDHADLSGHREFNLASGPALFLGARDASFTFTKVRVAYQLGDDAQTREYSFVSRDQIARPTPTVTTPTVTTPTVTTPTVTTPTPSTTAPMTTASTATPPTTTTPPAAAPTPPAVSGSGTPVARAKHEAPDAETQQEMLDLLKDLHKDDYAKALQPQQKVTLARRILSRAKFAHDDVPGAYVMLREAAKLSADAGEVRVMVDALQSLIESYTVDSVTLQLELFTAVAKHVRSAEDLRLLAEHCAKAAQEAIVHDRFVDAGALMRLAQGAASRSRDAASMKQMLEAARFLAQAETAFKELQPQMEALKSTPDDPEANFLVGKYTCCVKQDWEHGMPMLAKGSDASWKEAAAADLQNPRTPEAQMAVADLWWAIAETLPSQEQPAIKSRAATWYSPALPYLDGLSKAKAGKRLAEAPPP